MIERGYPNVSALEGGWNAWLEAGYPTERGEAERVDAVAASA